MAKWKLMHDFLDCFMGNAAITSGARSEERSSSLNNGQISEYERPAGRPAVATLLKNLGISGIST